MDKSTEKIKQLHAVAQYSFAIQVSTDVYKLQIQLLLEQIMLLKQHINMVEE